MKDKFLRFLAIAKKAGMLVEGYNNCEIAIKKGNAFLVVIANELSPNSKKKIERYCKDNIELIEGISEYDMNLYLGSNGVKVICIKDRNFSNNLLDLWKKTKLNINFGGE
ncbi:ribosomal protein L7Ae family protein [Clostridium tepidiprofundi DSM 19306]|uniref:Ribosomal protein L7Ae family protein n=1 Tax=Clostridium tepidiprofundi DSM 19306 TaxID=1121338 RepID=A0A151B7L1_9CLOT|nr:ribosomal L7Ae/L30e/S12e/Gadd45 family protein [Clostridium tepidiprofundi]KYH35793.1 ribosomal protein L7Ae family protein [Clostridium tepidiprofundi DSM 19306]